MRKGTRCCSLLKCLLRGNRRRSRNIARKITREIICFEKPRVATRGLESPMVDDLSQYLEGKRALVEEHLRLVLRLGDGCPPALVEAMRYGVLAPGKRLRPHLVIMGAEACARRCVDALPPAGALRIARALLLIYCCGSAQGERR